MNGKFQMTVGQAQKFERAVVRAGLDAKAVEFLSQGNNLIKALQASGFDFNQLTLIDIKKFFQDSTSLCVDKGLVNLISRTFPEGIIRNSIVLVPAFTIPISMTDTEIHIRARNLGFDEKALLTTLDQIKLKIELQMTGKYGDLLTEVGSVNIFYFQIDKNIFSVSVLWDNIAKQWNIYCRPFDHGEPWRHGCQIFRNNT